MMQYRQLGKTGWKISEISLGTWQVGGTWGTGFDEKLAARLLHEAVEAGVNFIDTADVYESGESEKAVGRYLRGRSDVYVATKCGRQINPHVNEGYTPAALRGYVEDSLRRLQRERIDLIQLHCPPTEVYYRPEIFGLFEDLQREGKIGHLGVSVEKVEEGLKAIEYDNVVSVQIIYNLFRQRPAERFFGQAAERNVGIIARVPLASGLLTGKFDKSSTFNDGDHRHGNRNGEWFDKGETFAGVPYDVGIDAVEELKAIFPRPSNLAPLALRWILMNEHVSCVIPGATRTEHIQSNLRAAASPSLTPLQMAALQAVYEARIKPLVHQLW